MEKNNINNFMRLLLIFLSLYSSALWAYPVAHYVGFGTGYTWTQADFNDKGSSLGAFSDKISYSDVSSDNLPWRGFVGFRFHPNYGIELGYLDYGSIKFTKTLNRVDTSEDNIQFTSVREADITTQGFYLEHVLSYPISDNFIVQGRAGVIVGETHYSELETLTTPVENEEPQVIVQPNSSNDGFVKAQLGFSALYQSSEQWFWRLQVNQIDIDHSDESESFSHWFTSLSLEYQLQE